MTVCIIVYSNLFKYTFSQIKIERIINLKHKLYGHRNGSLQHLHIRAERDRNWPLQHGADTSNDTKVEAAKRRSRAHAHQWANFSEIGINESSEIGAKEAPDLLHEEHRPNSCDAFLLLQSEGADTAPKTVEEGRAVLCTARARNLQDVRTKRTTGQNGSIRANHQRQAWSNHKSDSPER